jgi:hypothetical protein
MIPPLKEEDHAAPSAQPKGAVRRMLTAKGGVRRRPLRPGCGRRDACRGVRVSPKRLFGCVDPERSARRATSVPMSRLASADSGARFSRDLPANICSVSASTSSGRRRG